MRCASCVAKHKTQNAQRLPGRRRLRAGLLQNNWSCKVSGNPQMKISQASAYAMHALMYMVRHMTQLPVTCKTIAKSEGIPAGYLSKVLQQVVKAGFIRSVRGQDRGYVFVRPPEEISLLQLFEAMEGHPMFDDCPLRHCACGGTTENCRIFARWATATRALKGLLAEITIVSAAWNHPEHRFDMLPDAMMESMSGDTSARNDSDPGSPE
jgi:Rrf2 family protein